MPPSTSQEEEQFGESEEEQGLIIISDHDVHLPPPLRDGCPDFWAWDKFDRSHEVRVVGPLNQAVHFHPNWSNGTAGVRGTKVLNHGVHYWEVNMDNRVFGTSMMIGIGTKKARVHVDAFINLIGEDTNSWGLSHKGLLWHAGKWRQYTRSFRENEATTIGVLVDWNQGTLTYYKDGESLGVAFTGLNRVQDEVFPFVCSTAAKTDMCLGVTLRAFDSLQDRCRAVIAQHCQNNGLSMLPLPERMKGYIQELM